MKRRAKIAVGMRVVTSGHGGVFPPGLPVGKVVGIDGRRVIIAPHVDWNRVSFIRIVDYAATGLVKSDRPGKNLRAETMPKRK